MNRSGITPQGNKVLVLPDMVKDETDSGIVTHTKVEGERIQMAQTFGVLVDVGKEAWYDRVKEVQREHWAVVGERVIFAKYAGLMCKGLDGNQYRLISDYDIVATCDNKLSTEYGERARIPVHIAEAA